MRGDGGQGSDEAALPACSGVVPDLPHSGIQNPSMAKWDRARPVRAGNPRAPLSKRYPSRIKRCWRSRNPDAATLMRQHSHGPLR